MTMVPDYLAIGREALRKRAEARRREAARPLAQRILVALADGSSLRPRQIAERCGVTLDIGTSAATLRLLPGRELFEALAKLLDAGKVATDSGGKFWIHSEVRL